MAAAALARSIRCNACRNDVVQSFVLASGLSVGQKLRPPNQPHTRRLFTVSNLRSESSHLDSDDNTTKEGPSSNRPSLVDTPKPPQSVPWYLQVDSAPETLHPAAKRAELPVVPENAPPITQEMLQHLAEEIGLDDMKLLDLRGRDPPPALGVNLIMIIGTARSLKHLNVSADRFCRWLRSTYKLRPYADGLLGRNELKIKLRRKARRARLASSSGTVADTSDDGITTGWICVNVGNVDNPSASKDLREGGFEGFGKVQGGTRIVVQMFTEEKRADVDLEHLWAPKRSTNVEDSATSNEPTVQGQHQVRPEFDMIVTHLNSNQEMHNVLRPPRHPAINQTRSFSSARQLLSRESSSIDITAIHDTDPNDVDSPGRIDITAENDADLNNVDSPGRIDITAENDADLNNVDGPVRIDIADVVVDPYGDNVDDADTNDKDQERFLFYDPDGPEMKIAKMILQLEEMPKEEIFRQLGKGPDDKNSTEFLKNCYDSLGPQLSHYVEYRLRLELAAAGIAVQHPNYTKEYLWAIFLEYTSCGYELLMSQGLHIVSAFLTPRLEYQELAEKHSHLIDFDIESALRVLDHLSARGSRVHKSPLVQNLLYKVLKLRELKGDTESIKTNLFRIRQIMEQFPYDFKISKDYPYLQTMQLRFELGDVDGFYDIWLRTSSIRGYRLPTEYELLFRVHAEGGNPILARECLTTWIPMMNRESRPIDPDVDLIFAIARCARVAGYKAANFRLSSVSDEWQKAHSLIVEEMEEMEEMDSFEAAGRAM